MTRGPAPTWRLTDRGLVVALLACLLAAAFLSHITGATS